MTMALRVITETPLHKIITSIWHKRYGVYHLPGFNTFSKCTFTVISATPHLTISLLKKTPYSLTISNTRSLKSYEERDEHHITNKKHKWGPALSWHCRLLVVKKSDQIAHINTKRRKEKLYTRSPSISPPNTPQELNNHNNKNPESKPSPPTDASNFAKKNTQLNNAHEIYQKPSGKYCNSDPQQKKNREKERKQKSNRLWRYVPCSATP